ncbi:MAG: methyltransferase dimerization domain-containing protein, partial [Pirellulales bacterium]
MAIDITPADPTIVLELMAAYRRSKVMFAAVDLGIFDVLEAGHRTATDVATQLQCDESAMTRLLHALVGLGLVEEREGMFGNSDVAHTYLTRSSPQRFTGYIQYSNDVGW